MTVASRVDKASFIPRLAGPILAAAILPAFLIPAQTAGAQGKPDPNGEGIQVLPVQGNVHLIAGAGGNVTVQTGPQGVLVVDTGNAQFSEKVLAEIRKLSPNPIRMIINTGVDPDHVGGNEVIQKAGISVIGGVVGYNAQDIQRGAQILAHENAYNRMNGMTGGKSPWPQAAWPTDPYSTSPKRVFFNDEGIEVIHVPAAHSDSDSIVFFRRSDVISAGEIFVTTGYPVIDLLKGGSVQGIIDGLNRILDLTIAKQESEGGTYVIPGRGRICDQFDVLEYRDMVTIVRDRIQDLIKKNKTLEQIKAAKPTEDYDARYAGSAGPGTSDHFIETVYKSLVGTK